MKDEKTSTQILAHTVPVTGSAVVFANAGSKTQPKRGKTH